MRAAQRMKLFSRMVSAALLMTFPAACWGQIFLPRIASGTIFGKVLFTSDNRPAEHIQVQLQLPGGAWAASTSTGLAGEFDFEALAVGSYLVVVEEPGYEVIQERVDVDLGSRSVQLRLTEIPTPVPDGPRYAISASELRIPAKARQAFDNGMLRLSENDPAGSLADLRRAIARFPAYYEAYYQVGMASLQLERQDDAERAFRKAIEESDGRYAQAQVALGAMLCDQGKFVEAEKPLRKGLELDEASWLGHFFLARTLFGLSRWDEAEQRVHETMVLNAELPEAYLLLSAIHFNQNNYDAMLGDLDAYLKLAPNSPAANQAKAVREKVLHELAQQESSQQLAVAKVAKQ